MPRITVEKAVVSQMSDAETASSSSEDEDPDDSNTDTDSEDEGEKCCICGDTFDDDGDLFFNDVQICTGARPTPESGAFCHHCLEDATAACIPAATADDRWFVVRYETTEIDCLPLVQEVRAAHLFNAPFSLDVKGGLYVVHRPSKRYMKGEFVGLVDSSFGGDGESEAPWTAPALRVRQHMLRDSIRTSAAFVKDLSWHKYAEDDDDKGLNRLILQLGVDDRKSVTPVELKAACRSILGLWDINGYRYTLFVRPKLPRLASPRYTAEDAYRSALPVDALLRLTFDGKDASPENSGKFDTTAPLSGIITQYEGGIALRYKQKKDALDAKTRENEALFERIRELKRHYGSLNVARKDLERDDDINALDSMNTDLKQPSIADVKQQQEQKKKDIDQARQKRSALLLDATLLEAECSKLGAEIEDENFDNDTDALSRYWINAFGVPKRAVGRKRGDKQPIDELHCDTAAAGTAMASDSASASASASASHKRAKRK